MKTVQRYSYGFILLFLLCFFVMGCKKEEPMPDSLPGEANALEPNETEDIEAVEGANSLESEDTASGETEGADALESEGTVLAETEGATALESEGTVLAETEGATALESEGTASAETEGAAASESEEITSDETEETAALTAGILYVILSRADSVLNVRSEQSTEGQVIGKLQHNEQVEVLEVENGWAKISYENGTGYVASQYLKNESDRNVEETSHSIQAEGVYIEVYKEDRILKLWEDGSLIGEYPIGLGFQTIGHKKREGDGRTPEGSYYVCVRNPNSRFYLSLGVSYPNVSDAEAALDSGEITQTQYDSIVNAIDSGGCPPWNTPLGGEIMIHGNGSDSDWTAGCVAVNNDVMDILWEKCAQGTKILIYP